MIIHRNKYHFWANSIFLDDRVSNLDNLNTGVLQNQTVKTQNGKEIECNLVLRCVGSRPNTSLTQNILGK